MDEGPPDAAAVVLMHGNPAWGYLCLPAGGPPGLNRTLRHGLRSILMAEDDQHEWSIGELADTAGVSARTLRHYESEGLLEPRERSDGGHRRYGEEELERLRRIVALRRLGFGLEAISRLLAAGNRDTLLEVTRQQLQRVEIDLEVANKLRVRLRELLRHLERNNGVGTVEQVLNAMEAEMEIKLDEIYTGLGDSGETHLGNLARVSKTDPRIEAGGELDELGATLGRVLAAGEIPDPDAGWLRRVANDLFDIGNDLSKPPGGANESSPRIGAEYTTWLELTLKEANAELEPLDSFVVSFGPEIAGQLDVLRAQCRRAERRVVAVADVNPEIVRYLNRLSDLFFVLSRRAASGDEQLWQPGRGAELAS